MKNLIEEYVGKTATIFTGGLKVEVTITDVKTSYGRNRYLVTPIAGSGEVWVESVNVQSPIVLRKGTDHATALHNTRALLD